VSKTFDGFTSRYNVGWPACYGEFSEATAAIAREKQIKAESRARKIALIQAMNPAWEDLFEGLIRQPWLARDCFVASLLAMTVH